MKKYVSILLLTLLFLTLFSSCGKTEKEYTLSIGIFSDDALGKKQVTDTVAALVLDSEGRIVLCRIDSAEAVAEISGDGVASKTFKTKAELGEDYGMLSEYGSSLAEWDDQVRYYEEFAKGKTVPELTSVKTGDSELSSGCTIDVTPFAEAVARAAESKHKAEFMAKGDISLGVSLMSSVKAKDKDASFLADTAAVVLSGGRVISAVIDSKESLIKLVNGDGVEYLSEGSKLELGEDYGMVEYGGASSEWYVQAQKYSSEAIGKSVAELSGMPTEGVAGCTISVEGYKKALILAGDYAR